MDLGTALQLIVAVAMPFVLLVLGDVRKAVRDLRAELAPVVPKVAVLETKVATVEHQLHLMDSQ